MIRTKDLKKIYITEEVETTALNNVNLEVQEGEYVAVMGPSGCGKSTLLNLIGGLDTATSGSIIVDGKDLAAIDRSGLARHRRHTAGMVFQSFNLISHRSALENVMLALVFGGVPRGQRKARAAELLRRVGLGERLDHKPSELSGGEAQRVALARALANDPDVLLLDEPTGNLDSATAGEIIDLIAGLNRDAGLTAVMVTHERDMADRVSSRVVELLDGAIVGEGRRGVDGGVSDGGDISRGGEAV